MKINPAAKVIRAFMFWVGIALFVLGTAWELYAGAADLVTLGEVRYALLVIWLVSGLLMSWQLLSNLWR